MAFGWKNGGSEKVPKKGDLKLGVEGGWADAVILGVWSLGVRVARVGRSLGAPRVKVRENRGFENVGKRVFWRSESKISQKLFF